MRLIIHTKVGTFVKDNAREIDKLYLLTAVNSCRDTFEITCRPEGPSGTTGTESRCVFRTSDYRYLEIED
jgi:hypothetical protein